jgi:PAS domain-containing protein
VAIIGVRYRTQAGMLSSIVPSIVAGHALLLAALGIAALASVGVWYRRLVVQNRRLSNALDNMTQGSCMFDAQGSVVLTNRRYIGMYNLSPEIVRPGCSLRKLMQHRKETGLFSGDIEAYCRRIFENIDNGQSTQFYVQSSDGHIVLAKNEPLPGGGWVSTMRTLPNNAAPSRNAPRAKSRSSGARPSTRRSPRSGRRRRSFDPA